MCEVHSLDFGPSTGPEKEVESEILDALGALREPFGPRELINKLTTEKKLNDTLIREAIWQLIDLKRIRLTDDMKLEVAA